MKKLILIMVVMLIFGSGNIALAAMAASDVPAGHWAYSAIKELMRVGVLDGYPDGSFRGDKAMTRYEMAQIVEKAIANANKATAQQKYLIDKLGVEFALEINKINTRVDALEKNQSALKIDGFFQYRYEYTKHPRPIPQLSGKAGQYSNPSWATDKSETRSILWLNISNQFDGDTYFHGILACDSLGGRTLATPLLLREANFNKKIGDGVEIGLGRFFPDLGFGTIGGAPYMDGAKLSFGKEYRVNVYSVKLGDIYGYPNRTYLLGDIKTNLGKDFTMSVAYNADKQKEMYDSTAIGLSYKGAPNVVLDTEFGKNAAAVAKIANSGTTPKAYFARVRYKGANPTAVGSFGLSAEYKKADPGFDTLAFADPFTWNSPLNWSTPGMGGIADNVKGFEYGFDLTIAKRTILSLRYDRLDRVRESAVSAADNQEQNFFTAQVTYLF